MYTHILVKQQVTVVNDTIKPFVLCISSLTYLVLLEQFRQTPNSFRNYRLKIDMTHSFQQTLCIECLIYA